MAVDKLVDSTKLDACLEAEAEAINAKTGETSALPFDFDGETGFADAIASIPTGTQRGASDVTVSGQTVTVPAGLYGSQVQKSVASGSAGTPTATKGSVSNHSVVVTPKVTNSTGYITGGTKTGSGVTVSASELVSGSDTKTENGTYDVTNLASLTVDVQGGEEPTLIEKTITQNGTYNASADSADGYSKVTVTVSGGGGATVVEEENEFGGITMTITE